MIDTVYECMTILTDKLKWRAWQQKEDAEEEETKVKQERPIRNNQEG